MTARPATAALGLALLTAAACAPRGGATPRYVPRVRDITITTVPLLTKEQRSIYPFLARDFAKGGVLEGKEVYAFAPSTITVIEGDTLRLTLVNPEDDEHTFVLPGCTDEDRESIRLPDCTVHLPGQAVTHAVYVARRAGIHEIACDLPSHAPFMSGQLVVLSAAAAGGAR
ncbi:MAG: hypothetical protein ACHQX4_06435 [Gemmatimonadales bacterium]